MHSSRFTSLMHCYQGAVVCLDHAGQILFANPAAARLLGQEAEQLEGVDFFKVYCDLPGVPLPGDHKEQDIQVNIAQDTRMLNCRFSHCVGDDCAPVAYMVAMTDRTDWYQVNEERDRLMEMATISEVLPGILHEFKNPLASIQALVELITEDCADEELQGQLHSILMEIRRMKLGFEGLGFSTRNLASTRDQAVDYGIREACTIFERQLKARRIALITDIETIPLIPLDSGGIRGVLFNLLNNAKQACRPGEGRAQRETEKRDPDKADAQRACHFRIL